MSSFGARNEEKVESGGHGESLFEAMNCITLER